jgi:hypothetical protein
MIYHVMGELDYLNRKSKMIPPIWALKEIRHLAEASEEPTIIQTDHAATVGIAKQTSMSTLST